MTPCAVTRIDSPVGQLASSLTLVASDAGLRAVLWPGGSAGRVRLPEALVEDDEHPVLVVAAAQLREYFDGKRTDFDVPLDLHGGEFDRRAWLALATIPYGATVTYGEQARRIGRPTAARAVGAANGRNPVSIVLPCHRVIGANGALTGFGGGLDAKRGLLDHEAHVLAEVVATTSARSGPSGRSARSGRSRAGAS